MPNLDGFVLRVQDNATPFTCLNQIGGKGGPLQSWTHENSHTDNGSTFRVTPAPTLYDGIRDLADTSAPLRPVCRDSSQQSPSSIIMDLAGRRLDRIRQPGVYIINGRKRLVR
jgi:hypothetical protein